MEVNIQGFISALNLRISGDRGWRVTTCIFCNKEDRLGVLLVQHGDNKPHFHCFKCGKAGSIRYLAKYIGRPELVSGEYIAPMNIGMTIDTDVSVEVPKCPPPIGFRRTQDHPYLDKRLISEYQRNLYKFGTSRVDPKVKKDYMITIVEEGGVSVGYVARSIMDKDWIDEYNRTHEHEYLRYQNSESDFSKIVFGLDEIEIDVTHTVITVEGMYDKFAVDRKLKLHESPYIKCCCAFGSKLSDIQAEKISMRGVSNSVILFDAGTVDKSKKVSRVSSGYFKNVKVSSLTGGDPDETNDDELIKAVKNAKSMTEYSLELNDFDL